MKICYLGHSSFVLTDSAGTSVVTDPFGDVGFSMPAVRANAVTVSHSHFDHNNVSAVGGSPAVFDSAGSFQVKNIRMNAFPCYHDNKCGALRGSNLIFKYYMDDITVCHMGDLGENYSQTLVEKIGYVDVLLLPVGGNYTIDAAQATRYVYGIRPAVVIPMHYKTKGLTVDVAGVEGFVRFMQSQGVRAQTGGCEISLCREQLTGNNTKLIILERANANR